MNEEWMQNDYFANNYNANYNTKKYDDRLPPKITCLRWAATETE